MKIVLSSRGSRGDIYPVIEIASALKEKGHNVAVAVPETFGEYTRSKGLEPFLYSENSDKVMQDFGHGVNSSKQGFNFIASSVQQQYDFMMKETEDADVLFASVSEMAAPTVAEYRKMPFYRIAYAPMLPGKQPPPLIPFQNMPKQLNVATWGVFQLLSTLVVKKLLDKKRKELGLPPVKDSNKYFTRESHTLLAINRTLAPPCNTWDKKYKFSYTGYCFGKAEEELPADLIEFIENGKPPVYIGFGSVHIKNPQKFTDIVIEASQKAGQRIVLSRGWTGLGNEDYPDNIFITDDTNHHALFPKMAGVIHHGGSGTTHMAAKAGVPQFIMPEMIDQFYWGNRVYKMGLGPKPVSSKKITVDGLAKALDKISDSKYRNNSVNLGEEIRKEDGVRKIIDLITKNNS
ncbi:MAG: glycosyltransferase family 1 protein [Chlorobi bacterium]|nr:glycosyltransferase family 1 protein [Chlorobiota bacterium]